MKKLYLHYIYAIKEAPTLLRSKTFYLELINYNSFIEKRKQNKPQLIDLLLVLCRRNSRPEKWVVNRKL